MAAVNSRDKKRLEERSSRCAWCTFGHHFLSSTRRRCAGARVWLCWRRLHRLFAIGQNSLFFSLAWQLGRRKGVFSVFEENTPAELNFIFIHDMHTHHFGVLGRGTVALAASRSAIITRGIKCTNQNLTITICLSKPVLKNRHDLALSEATHVRKCCIAGSEVCVMNVRECSVLQSMKTTTRRTLYFSFSLPASWRMLRKPTQLPWQRAVHKHSRLFQLYMLTWVSRKWNLLWKQWVNERIHKTFFIWHSNRERKRKNADLEDKIRERRWPNVLPLGLHQWNKIRGVPGALWSYSTDEARVTKRLAIFVLLSCPLNLHFSFFVLCCCLKTVSAKPKVWSGGLRPAGSDPEVVCQKDSFLKVSVSLGGFDPSVAMENILWDDIVFKLRKNKAEACSLLDAIGRRSCGRWRVGIKIDVWENPVVYASTWDWSSLYGAIRSEPETAAQSSCSHFWTSLGTLMLSLFCMHRSGCS